MHTLYFFNMVSLDGYFEGKEPWDLAWHTVDAEFNIFAVEQLQSTGLLLFGRKTYEGMAQYWSTDQAKDDDPAVAGLMNAMPKIVVSRTLTAASWNNTTLLNGNIIDEIKKLKSRPGKDIGIFGSSNLAVTLMQHGLIDEFRIMVSPTVIGGGVPLFHGFTGTLPLRLTNSRSFNNGNMLLYYQPVIQQ